MTNTTRRRATIALHYTRQFSREWERMVRDPLFRAMGGCGNIKPAYHKRDYVRRRWAELRRFNPALLIHPERFSF